MVFLNQRKQNAVPTLSASWGTRPAEERIIYRYADNLRKRSQKQKNGANSGQNNSYSLFFFFLCFLQHFENKYFFIF